MFQRHIHQTLERFKSIVTTKQSTVNKHHQLIKSRDHRTKGLNLKLTPPEKKLIYSKDVNAQVDWLENKMRQMEDKLDKITKIQMSPADVSDIVVLKIAHHDTDKSNHKRSSG